MHVLRQLEKTIFRPATRCNHKEMRIDSHAASASDAPMPTTRCPKSARAQAVSVEIDVPLYSGEGACELVLLQNGRPKVRHNNRRGRSHIAQNPVIRRVRFQPSRHCRLGRRERILTSRAETSRYGHIYTVGSVGALVGTLLLPKCTLLSFVPTSASNSGRVNHSTMQI